MTLTDNEGNVTATTCRVEADAVEDEAGTVIKHLSWSNPVAESLHCDHHRHSVPSVHGILQQTLLKS